MELSKLLSSHTIDDQSTRLQKHDDHDDRLSQLPEEIIHQIFSSVPGLRVSQWSMLSKTFLQYSRTYPKLGFHIGNGETRMIDASLQRYNQQRLPINKFSLSLSSEDALVSSLNRWLDILINNTHLQELVLYIGNNKHDGTYNIPSSIFTAKNLTRLFIHGTFGSNYSVSIGYDDFNCNKHTFEPPSLRTLTLFMVMIKPCVLQKLISKCPNIETLSLSSLSPGLKKLEVHGLQKIKKLSIRYCNELTYVSIDNTPNLEIVSITGEKIPQVDTGPKLKGVSFSS